jgi:hypothetical protein
MSERERIDLVCPRCGKTRFIDKQAWLQRGKHRICAICAMALGRKRCSSPPHLQFEDETLDEKLDAISRR